MNNNPLLRTAMQYGAYSGLSYFVFFLLLYFATTNPLGNKSWLGFWIPILFIVLGTKFHRDKELGGFITYGQALGAGTLISVCATLLYTLLVFLFCTVADPLILENYKNETLQGMEEAKKFLSNEKLLSAMDEAQNKIAEMTVAEFAQSVFFNGISGGFIISLITGAIFRKKKSIFDDPADNPPA